MDKRTVTKANGLPHHEVLRICDIAANGRSHDLVRLPVVTPSGTPKCSACGSFYPKGRLTAGVKNPHICCHCQKVVDDHPDIAGSNPTSHYPAHFIYKPSNRDDI